MSNDKQLQIDLKQNTCQYTSLLISFSHEHRNRQQNRPFPFPHAKVKLKLRGQNILCQHFRCRMNLRADCYHSDYVIFNYTLIHYKKIICIYSIIQECQDFIFPHTIDGTLLLLHVTSVWYYFAHSNTLYLNCTISFTQRSLGTSWWFGIRQWIGTDIHILPF